MKMRDAVSVVGLGEDHGNTVLSNAREEKIFVSIRVRPLNERERARHDVSEWECISGNAIRFKNHGVAEQRSMSMDTYTFDRVFGERCSTKQVYEQGIKEVALSVVNGINCSIFAYGQTSSGKTYTMTGITDYAVRDIYEYIEKHKEREFILKFSAMEIYNEAVRDLLSANATSLRLLDDPEKGTVVEKLTEETLTESGQLRQLLSICAAERTTEETAMNETSSRSHQILRLTVESNPSYVDSARSGTLTASVNFVDLAGSERASQTLSAGTRLREGSHINRSLLTLGTVIRKLSKGRNGHIPYRDSKLTRILHNSLGGNARTAIICTISPARSQVEQSRNTLFFASCAKQVATNAQVNLVMSDKVLVKQLQRELARMENELRKFAPNTTLLKERELQIEQMDKKIQELTQQRDHFQSHVENLLQSVGKDKLSGKDKDRASESSGVTNNISLGTDDTGKNFHKATSGVSISNEQLLQQSENSEDNFLLDGNPPTFVEPDPCQGWASESSGVANNIHPRTDTTSENVDRTSRVSISNDHLLQQSDNPEDYFLLDDSSPMFVGPDPCQGWEEMTSRAKTVDTCKEVPCIEIKEVETDHKADGNTSIPVSEETGGNSPMIQVVNIDAESSSGNVHSDLSRATIDNNQDGLQQKTEDLQKTSNLLVESESEPHVLAVMSPPQIDNGDQDASPSRSDNLDQEPASPPQFDEQEIKTMLPPQCDEQEQAMKQNASPSRLNKLDQESTPPPQFNDQELKTMSTAQFDEKELKTMSPPQFDEQEIKTMLPPQCDEQEQAMKQNDSPSRLNKLEQEPASPPQFNDQELKTMSPDQFDEQELKTMSPPQYDEQELKTMSPPQCEEMEQESVRLTPGTEREYYNSLVCFNDKLSKSKLRTKKRNSSRTYSLVQEMGASVEDVESVLDSETEDTASVLNFVVRMNARGKTKSFNEDLGDIMVRAKTPGMNNHGNRVKGINFHGVSGPLMPSKYERRQRDIIELWDACNVPLVHRTYFFLLIKGELSDSVYLDVELRRLSFLKDTFSSGNYITGEEGQDITPNSSLMSLNRERKMLSKQVHKKFSRKEREELYLRWGIDLKSKHRSIQLAWLLWTNTKDLNHVRESAALVAKLVGFINSGETPKRTFGLGFLRRKSHNWKDTTSTLF